MMTTMRVMQSKQAVSDDRDQEPMDGIGVKFRILITSLTSRNDGSGSGSHSGSCSGSPDGTSPPSRRPRLAVAQWW